MTKSVRYSTIPKVRAREHAIEREVLAFIKRDIRDGWAKSAPLKDRFAHMFLLSSAWRYALDRLHAKKLVKLHKTHLGYVPTESGWRSR